MVVASLVSVFIGICIGFKLGRAMHSNMRTRRVDEDYAVVVRNYLRSENFAKDRPHLEEIASQIRERGQLSVWD